MESKKALILVIDDSVEVREFFEAVLQSAGYEVALAADGEAGLVLARALHPNLIITDIWMPRMNGLELLVHLRSDLPPPLPPVIVCSGFDVTGDEALRLGAVRFLAKPVEPAALQATVARALEGEEIDESALDRERQLMKATRARATACAARLLADVDLRSPEVVGTLDRFAQWVSDYFGYGSAGLVFPQGEHILVAGTSNGSPFSSGTILPGDLLYAGGVLCGASLVLPDSAAYHPDVAKNGIRMLVAVPILSEKAPIGALCLLAPEPHGFDAEDLLVLQDMGHGAATELAHLAAHGEPRGKQLGFLSPSLFDAMLAAELSILHKQGGGVELLLIDIDPAGLRPEVELQLLAQGGARSGVSRRGNGTVAIFKRDASQPAATRVIGDALSLLSSATAVQATGWVSVVDRGLPLVPQQLVSQIAGMALDYSRSNGAPKTERIVLSTLA
jgi:CheY-like chemotaxis protein